MSVELCHKCYGDVTGDIPELHGCSCISWGKGIFAKDIRSAAKMQLEQAVSHIRHYLGQKRPPTDFNYEVALKNIEHALKAIN